MKPLFLTFLSILFFFTAFSQEVKTVVPGNSGIDDALFIASDGTFYGSGFNNGNLYTIHAGTATLFTSRFGNANGIAEDSKGNIFVADHFASAIFKIEPDSAPVLFQNIGRPSGLLKMIGSDTLLVTGYSSDKIFKLAPDGNSSLYLDDPLLDGPVGMVYDENGRLYIGNFDDERVLYVDSAGAVKELCTLPNGNMGFITYASGFLYATVLNQNKIYRINPQTGGFEVFAGSTAGSSDGTLATATFNGPNGIVANATGDTLYVSDFVTESVRMITGFTPPSSTSISPSSLPGVELKVIENPARKGRELLITAEHRFKGTLRIRDIKGRIVYQHASMFDAGATRKSLALELTSGVYLVTLSTEKGALTKKYIQRN